MFEEKSWKHPGVDVSDFFNFGLDEEHWKEYYKQVEQLRLESAMQSKIRVYESGRSEQNYDPDLPPELAAATSHQDMSAYNTNHVRSENGQADLSGQRSGNTGIRTPLPTGRSIYVESGSGERFPSIDTRPPRIRDSDAVIEIVLQDNLDYSTFSNGTLELQANNFGENLKGFHDYKDVRPAVIEYSGYFLHNSKEQQRESAVRRVPLSPEGDGVLPFPSKLSFRPSISPKPQSPIDSARSLGTQHGRRLLPRTFGNSSSSEQSDKIDDANQAPELLPSNIVEVRTEFSIKSKNVECDNFFTLDASSDGDGEEPSDYRVSIGTVDDNGLVHSTDRRKGCSCVEQLAAHDNNCGDDSKLIHNDDSRANLGNSREDHQKRHECGDEVLQDHLPKHMRDFHKYHGKNYPRHRDDYPNPIIPRGRETILQFQGRSDGSERNKYVRRGHNDQKRLRERAKVRVTNCNEKTKGHIKRNADGDWRVHSKSGVIQHRERDDILMNCRKKWEDGQLKQKRDAKLSSRARADTQDYLHGYRTRERKMERDDIAGHRKREHDDRTMSKTEKHLSIDLKEENLYRGDREDRQRLKLSHDDTFSSRETEERRLASRIGRSIKEKALSRSGRRKEYLRVAVSDNDYHHKDRRRHNEQLKRGNLTGEEHDSLNKERGGSDAREKQHNTEKSTRCPPDSSDEQEAQKEEHHERTKKSKDFKLLGKSRVYDKRNHKDGFSHCTKHNSKGSSEQESCKHSTSEGKKARNDAEEQGDPASDVEIRESRRGRSKLERWMSHKEERDYITINKDTRLPAAMIREVESSQGEPNEPVKPDADHKIKNIKTIACDVVQATNKEGEEHDHHVHTVAKLRMGSQGFKPPIPDERDKDLTRNKNAESEAPACIQKESASTTTADTDVKFEHPAWKSRRTGS